MAERSTAAVDVAHTGGADDGDTKPLAARTDEATSDGAGTQHDSTAPELHSGHRLARRYRLEECVTRLDGFSSWRAMDEKLQRAVGVHLLPADHARARSVLAAARSAALLGDPRFVQVLDAVEENDLVYVVHEWLPDATPLTRLFAAGPLEPHEAYHLVNQLAQAMAAAHREGLAHLRLTPGSVLRTGSGQYRIRGLAVNAALRGISSDTPQRTDTEAVGALLYAALTQRWPYEEDAYGLTGVARLSGGILMPPDQVRAGVHRGLSELAMRALVNDGATASSEDQPCATPEELVKAVAAMPRIKPPEPTFTQPPPYRRTTYQQGSYGPQTAHAPTGPPPPVAADVPPALPGKTGKALKWGVSALLIAALGLGSWQIADALMNGGRENQPVAPTGSDDTSKTKTEPKPLKISDAQEYYPDGRPQNAGQAAATHDGDPETFWRTKSFQDGPTLAPYKAGVGVIYDLGEIRSVSTASIKLRNGGDHTSVSLYAARSFSPSASLDSLRKVDSVKTSTTEAEMTLDKPIRTRYLVVWFTAVPYSSADGFSGAGYRQALSDVSFTG
ncbi:protein kinase family protein [Streptomyces sp. 549]|uniref:protein kinase family protein n=1 Tax=Streptomyces sp. 549 TaxID=3049076 RepID=UPI0024C2D236|nr:protein kinase family protein [Streptomyces sp. 549]MDK1476907.1 protein kinase family protein [Streptomyces sp. 549]